MKKIYYLLFILAIAFSLESCKDGDVGPAGADGTDGVDGVDGADGENGVGYDELTQYGNITIYLEGLTPDSVSFTDTADYKYTATNDLYDANYVGISDTANLYYAQRFLSSPDDVYQEARTAFGIRMIKSTEEPDIFFFGITKSVITDDYKSFFISESVEWSADELENLSITDYSFDETTHNLKFKFSFTMNAADSNDLDYDLSVSCEVDVIVLERI